VLAAAIACGIWLTQRGGSAGAAPGLSVQASQGDVVVSVGGVGRVVSRTGATVIEVPAASPSSNGTAPAGGSSTSAPADAVFPRASGRVVFFSVRPGQHVAAGQRLALLDDGSVAAAAARQAALDLATARIELSQRLHSDPQKGIPPTPAELAAAAATIASANADLTQAIRRTRPAEVTAAQADLRRSQADLQALRGGTSSARARAISLAKDRVTAAQKRLDRVLAGATRTDVSAAQAEVRKAEADMAILQKAPATPLPQDVAAAQFAVTAAQQSLADAKAASPVDPAAVNAAQLELDKAIAALAALQPPLAQEFASAQAALDASRTKLAALQGPPDPAEVATARQDLVGAQADLRTLRAGPSPKSLASAREAVASARAKLTQTRGPAALTAARLAVTRAVADQAALKARSGPASPSDIALARVRYHAAQARLSTARADLRHLIVRSPRTGTVTALLTERGAPVDATTPIASVTNLQRLAVRVDLSEFDVARVHPGQKAIVRVDALGGKAFGGRVLFAALAGTDKDGVVTFPVIVALNGLHGPRPGMNVSVRIIIAQRKDVVALPIDAVSHDGEDRPVVAVVRSDGTRLTRHVKLGLANNKSVEIVQGLRPGERVAVDASSAAGGQ
jgi:HlyD family secretion protein